MKYRVGVVNWKIRRIKSDGDFFAHIFDFVNQAHEQGVNVLVLPELFVLELLQLETQLKEHESPRYLVQYAEELESWLTRISEGSDMILIGGSHFKETERGIENVCAVAHPQFGMALASKNIHTTYERTIWNLQPGLGLVKLPDVRLGVTICYDSEFPESGRTLAEEGMLLQCVPSYTETEYGFNRVRFSCHARAIENQIFVAHSSLVGDIGREPVASTFGTSAIITPSIFPFRPTGVLAETELNEEGMAVADLDFDQLLAARDEGDVRNWNDRAGSKWEITPGL